MRARLLGTLTLALAAACTTPTTTRAPIVVPTTPAPPQQTPVAPASIEIPAINVNAPMVPLGLAKDGTVAVPDLNHVDQVSWYCQDYQADDGVPSCPGGGVIPGSIGPAAAYGHIDGHRRDGAFKHLPELHAGDLVKIHRADQSILTFKVYRVQQVHKRDFDSKQVYGDVQKPELRLLTCTGKFIGGQLGYEDQGIVYAALA